MGLEAQNEREKLAALHPAAQGCSKKLSPGHRRPSSSPALMLHHQHFPLRDTGSVPSASAHSSALVTLWDLQQGRRREQVVVVPTLAVVAEVVTLSPAHESLTSWPAAAPGLHGMAVLADAVSCCILLLSHTAVPGLSRSFQGDGMGFSKGTGFPRAARHPQEGMVEQDSCWRGGCWKQSGAAGTDPALGTLPHSPAALALAPHPGSCTQPQQRRARHTWICRMFNISHLLPRHLCHLAVSQPGYFLPNDFSCLGSETPARAEAWLLLLSLSQQWSEACLCSAARAALIKLSCTGSFSLHGTEVKVAS